MKGLTCSLALAAILFTGACAPQDETTPEVTASQDASATTEPAPAAVQPATPETILESPTNENPLGGNDPEDSLMPSVLCMDLQTAQNEIQDHGVFFSGSTDATGEDRSQVIDSNWIVVGQFPEPGTPIGEADAELFVVKFGEESLSLVGNPC